MEEKRKPSRNEDVLAAYMQLSAKVDAMDKRHLEHMLKEEPILNRAQINMERAEQGMIEVGAPGGWKGKLTGIDTKLVLLALLIIASAWGIWMMWQENQKAEAANKSTYLEQHKVTQALLGTTIANQKAILNAVQDLQASGRTEMSEVSYMLTLSPKQREAMNLSMPYSLRQKLNSTK